MNPKVNILRQSDKIICTLVIKQNIGITFKASNDFTTKLIELLINVKNILKRTL